MTAINVTIFVPLRRVLDVIVNAMDSGAFRYWIDPDTLREQWPQGWGGLDAVPWLTDDDRASWKGVRRCYFAPLVEGGALVFALEDREPGQADCRLDLASIARGLEVMATKEPRHFADLVSENDDAETADVFVQCCVLGEVVYG